MTKTDTPAATAATSATVDSILSVVAGRFPDVERVAADDPETWADIQAACVAASAPPVNASYEESPMPWGQLLDDIKPADEIAKHHKQAPLRRPEEVFPAESLQSLRGCPIATIGQPPAGLGTTRNPMEDYAATVEAHAERCAVTGLSEVAGRLLDKGADVNLRAHMLDLAAKWDAIAGDGRDKRSTTLGGCARDLRELAGRPS